VKSRIFRFISPVFRLRENGEPDKLINIALVNQPAITGMKPIINQSNEEILTMEITRDELTELIKSTVAAMNSAPTTEVKTEEESTEAESTEAETKEVETTEVETTEVENTCSEEETKNEEPETT
jgi:phage I-like protein